MKNADNNTYAPGVEQLRALSYRENGYLWKVTNATKGYIGEKAVGFKSVFNVANAAWISTGYYTFRFARDSVLSMIVPIWCDINAAPTVSERTRFCRQIMKIQDRKIVKADLLRLQMEPLLFIRKLRNINVCIYDVGSVKVTAGFALKRRQLPDPQPQTTNTYVLNGKFREAKFPGRQGTMPGASYEANLCDFRRTRHSTT
ncbi:hypothetical protein B0A48_15882 [Cryoendolithus antarcticus]|uniref:Uncharacterized protein n=1 Tax=Cryoendolithus antarcticus TaxID=1507870 RepID=A0A1V8SGE0_9PEZI|nr:hypothetical protein B0A48_15882 [Cryoendolithus antarcticus]